MRWIFTCIGYLYCIGSVCNIVFLFCCYFSGFCFFVCLVGDLLFHWMYAYLVRCTPSSWANDRHFQHSHFLSSAATYGCHCGTTATAAAASLASFSCCSALFLPLKILSELLWLWAFVFPLQVNGCCVCCSKLRDGGQQQQHGHVLMLQMWEVGASFFKLRFFSCKFCCDRI